MEEELTGADICRRLKESQPSNGLFAGFAWKWSPDPFEISPDDAAELQSLGVVLHDFNRACNNLYYASVNGLQPEWISRWLDAGKPARLVQFSREKALRRVLPHIIRPDLLKTERGWILCELDSIPGGIGATAWLQEHDVFGGRNILGGRGGMRNGWRSIFPEGDVLVSMEASSYRPEMEWLNRGSNSVFVKDAETYNMGLDRPVYRFFEAFDLHNLPNVGQWMEQVLAGGVMTPPLKPFLEEKMWMGFFWMKPLEGFWRQELGSKNFERLQNLIPRTWVLNPEPLPPHATIHGLDIHDWSELRDFSQKRRRLVIKISGFSPLAWGARGISFGHDLPSVEWAKVVSSALAAFPSSPHIMQVFESAIKTTMRLWNEKENSVAEMQGRARVCPYYFVGNGEKIRLGGGLATFCPPDKKALHGMGDAVMAPVSERQRKSGL